jgi:hypothetical protein
MKKYMSVFFVFLLIIGSLKAQVFQQLKPAANPAYMILGVAPTEIERPSTPKEFVSSFQNGIVDGKMAPNFALEFTPRNLLPDYRNNWNLEKKMIDNVLRKQTLGRNLWHNLAISMATSASDTVVIGSLKKGNGLGFGIKTILINGKPKAETYEALLDLNVAFDDERPYDQLIAKILGLSNAINFDVQQMETLMNQAVAYEENNEPESDPVKREVRLDRKREILEHLRKGLRESVDWAQSEQVKRDAAVAYITAQRATLISKEARLLSYTNRKLAFAREGFIMDVNLAYMAHFEGNEWDAWHYAKFSGWTTLSYKWNLDKRFGEVNLLDAMLLVRYTGNDLKVDSTNYLDVGVKLQYTYDKLTVSGEGIYRKLNKIPTSVKTDFTYKAAINVEYVLTDRLTLKTSIGRNFDGNSAVYDQPNGKLFAVGGLNFSILTGQ